MMNLTAMDVRQLTEEPSAKVRGMLASKIAADYRLGRFSGSESAIANDIFRILIRDVEKSVRQALADQLAHCPQAPRDIVLKLADDEAEIATSVLEYSSVLTDDDLIAIIRSTQELAKWCAVARRERVPMRVSSALLATHNQYVLAELFGNAGAVLDEKAMLGSWDAIAPHASLLEALVARGGLPLKVAEKVFYAVSDEMKRLMATRYQFNTPQMHKAVGDIREWEMLGIIPAHSGADPNDDAQVEELVDDLYGQDRLTHSLLMRSLCVGNLNVFEAGIAKLAKVPRVNARILMLDPGEMGLKAIYKVAGMPEGFFEAIRTMLRLALEETEFGRVRRADFRKRIIDRIYVERYNRTIENMEYLVSIIGGKIVPAAASVH